MANCKSKYLSLENVRDKLQQMNSEMKGNIRSEMKEIKERLDTLTASLEENNKFKILPKRLCYKLDM